MIALFVRLTFEEGDVVGCGIDFTIKRAFFTKNGQMIGQSPRTVSQWETDVVGHVFSNLWEGLYPAVGLRTLGESLAVDLTGPFKFDIDSYARNLRDTTWSEALRPPPAFKPPPKETSPVSDLSDTVLPAVSRLHDPTDRVCAAWVLDHLRQEGHQDTLAALRKDMQSKRWLHPRLDDFAIPPLNETAGSKTTYDENSTLKSFETKEQAVLWLEQRLIDADVQPFPWPFCIDVGLEKDLPRLKIHRYLSLLRQADQARCTVSQTTTKGDTEMISRNLEKTEDVDLDIEALQWGRECVKESKDWSEEDRGLMSSATALMGLSPGHWPEDGVGGKAQRLADTERIVSALRGESSRRIPGLTYPFIHPPTMATMYSRLDRISYITKKKLTFSSASCQIGVISRERFTSNDDHAQSHGCERRSNGLYRHVEVPP